VSHSIPIILFLLSVHHKQETFLRAFIKDQKFVKESLYNFDDIYMWSQNSILNTLGKHFLEQNQIRAPIWKNGYKISGIAKNTAILSQNITMLSKWWKWWNVVSLTSFPRPWQPARASLKFAPLRNEHSRPPWTL
jgi:hypothetical protein